MQKLRLGQAQILSKRQRTGMWSQEATPESSAKFWAGCSANCRSNCLGSSSVVLKGETLGRTLVSSWWWKWVTITKGFSDLSPHPPALGV